MRVFLETHGYLWKGERKIEPKVKEDLISICLLMLQVNPGDRPSPSELLENDFFKDEPVPCLPADLLTGISEEPALNEKWIK